MFFSGGFVTYSMEEKSRDDGHSLDRLRKAWGSFSTHGEKMAEQARKLTAS